jgi:SnoaL-like domain
MKCLPVGSVALSDRWQIGKNHMTHNAKDLTHISRASSGDTVSSPALSKRYAEGSLERKNIELQQAYFQAGRAGDWDKVESFLAPDFALIESPVLPFRGTYRGKEGLKQLRQRINVELIETSRNDIYEMLAGGEYIVALMNLYAIDVDGSEIPLKISESFRWVEGKLHSATPYWYDPTELERAASAKKKRAEKKQESAR